MTAIAGWKGWFNDYYNENGSCIAAVMFWPVVLPMLAFGCIAYHIINVLVWPFEKLYGLFERMGEKHRGKK